MVFREFSDLRNYITLWKLLTYITPAIIYNLYIFIYKNYSLFFFNSYKIYGGASQFSNVYFNNPKFPFQYFKFIIFISPALLKFLSLIIRELFFEGGGQGTFPLFSYLKILNTNYIKLIPFGEKYNVQIGCVSWV